MCLTTMMCLVIEQVRKDFVHGLLLRHALQHLVLARLFEIGLAETGDEVDYPLIFSETCRSQ